MLLFFSGHSLGGRLPARHAFRVYLEFATSRDCQMRFWTGCGVIRFLIWGCRQAMRHALGSTLLELRLS